MRAMPLVIRPFFMVLWLQNSFRTHYIGQLSAGMDGTAVRLGGWVHETREVGKIAFILLRDHTGIVQIVCKGGELMKFAKLPKESVISVTGTVKKNGEAKKGFEIVPSSIENLNPLSTKIPFEVTGKVPADIDVRLDNRQIDLRRLETTAIFNIQSTILKAFGEFLRGRGFQEIRTPSIVEAATEGGADLFKIQYFEKQAYLAQSPQLYKQLAVIGGMDRVFMVAPVFRAEKHNTIFHLNEITQMDIEMGFADHNDAIGILADVFYHILCAVVEENKHDLEVLGRDLKPEKPVIVSYRDAVEKLAAEGGRIRFGEDFSRADEERICAIFGDAVIVKEYPIPVRAFYSMPSQSDKEVSNSFDLIYRGLEVSSGAQRIHIPEILIDSIRSRGLDEKDFEFYINAFREGAPPHAGWSLGLERLTMKITGMQNIRECALFPRDRERLKP